jgi:aspartate/methionine/tyrosine aminotransferase
MKVPAFQSERLLSLWQNHVEYDLTETGVEPLYLRELVTRAELDEIYESVQLRYIQTDGTPALKEAVCGLYTGMRPENLLLTNGSAEANFIAMWGLVEPGDEVIALLPNYLQVPGIARAFGADVKSFYLRPGATGWEPDLDTLRTLVTKRTRVIYLCNPNNPTGSVLDFRAMQAIVEAAASVGAWLLADEVYLGAELSGSPSPSFWGSYERALIVSGLSKAYTLPGLRVGWLAGPPEVIAAAWGRHDYTTITRNAISERLALIALQPEKRSQILRRNREIAGRNLALLEAAVRKHPDLFSFIPPKIGGVAFVGYNLPINSTKLVTRLLEERSILIVPGDAFGLDGYVRIGYGSKRLPEALGQIVELLAGLQTKGVHA